MKMIMKMALKWMMMSIMSDATAIWPRETTLAAPQHLVPYLQSQPSSPPDHGDIEEQETISRKWYTI